MDPYTSDGRSSLPMKDSCLSNNMQFAVAMVFALHRQSESYRFSNADGLALCRGGARITSLYGNSRQFIFKENIHPGNVLRVLIPNPRTGCLEKFRVEANRLWTSKDHIIAPLVGEIYSRQTRLAGWINTERSPVCGRRNIRSSSAECSQAMMGWIRGRRVGVVTF